MACQLIQVQHGKSYRIRTYLLEKIKQLKTNIILEVETNPTTTKQSTQVEYAVTATRQRLRAHLLPFEPKVQVVHELCIHMRCTVHRKLQVPRHSVMNNCTARITGLRQSLHCDLTIPIERLSASTTGLRMDLGSGALSSRTPFLQASCIV